MLEDLIEHCIRQLLEEYAGNPQRHLREIGQQARLHALLQAQITDECEVEIGDGEQRQNPFNAPDRVGRVQLEAKIQDPASPKGSERSDIVVLREGLPVRLTRYPNGPLDVVARVFADQVVAAIEIKAACSADKGQRHLFRKDVAKLLRLVPQANLSRHFVLIDKSLSLPGYPGNANTERSDWHLEDDGETEQWTPKARETCWVNSPRLRLIPELEQCAFPYVHVWDLEADMQARGHFRVRHRYANFVDEGEAV